MYKNCSIETLKANPDVFSLKSKPAITKSDLMLAI